MITYYAAQFGITLSIVDLHGINENESILKPLTVAAKNAWKSSRMNFDFNFIWCRIIQLFLWFEQTLNEYNSSLLMNKMKTKKK